MGFDAAFFRSGEPEIEIIGQVGKEMENLLIFFAEGKGPLAVQADDAGAALERAAHEGLDVGFAAGEIVLEPATLLVEIVEQQRLAIVDDPANDALAADNHAVHVHKIAKAEPRGKPVAVVLVALQKKNRRIRIENATDHGEDSIKKSALFHKRGWMW